MSSRGLYRYNLHCDVLMNGEQVNILNEKTITIEACNAVGADFEQYYDRLIDVSLFGYIISTVLILIIFKKVR